MDQAGSLAVACHVQTEGSSTWRVDLEPGGVPSRGITWYVQTEGSSTWRVDLGPGGVPSRGRVTSRVHITCGTYRPREVVHGGWTLNQAGSLAVV